MSSTTNERRPAGNGTAIQNAGERSTGNATDLRARARRHEYAILVLAERVDETVVSSFYTNLPAAERKVTRTRERGLDATLTLVRVTPVRGDLAALLALPEAVAE